jgi:HPt (histidine-containing phosphotransfer) domain-containing protein
LHAILGAAHAYAVNGELSSGGRSVERVLKEEAHALKGSAANLSLWRLAKAAEAIEAPCKALMAGSDARHAGNAPAMQAERYQRRIAAQRLRAQQQRETATSPAAFAAAAPPPAEPEDVFLSRFVCGPSVELRRLLREFELFVAMLTGGMIVQCPRLFGDELSQALQRVTTDAAGRTTAVVGVAHITEAQLDAFIHRNRESGGGEVTDEVEEALRRAVHFALDTELAPYATMFGDLQFDPNSDPRAMIALVARAAGQR